MNIPTRLGTGPIDVRTELLKVIGRRGEGVSRNELSREMRSLVTGLDPYFYEEELAVLVMEQKVSLSFCGPESHRIQVYSLGSRSGEISVNQLKKRCYKCEVLKTYDAFRRRPDSLDGYLGQCRKCENKQRQVNGWANRARKKRQELARLCEEGAPTPPPLEIRPACAPNRGRAQNCAGLRQGPIAKGPS